MAAHINKPSCYLFIPVLFFLGYLGILFTSLPTYINPFSVNAVLGITAIIASWERGPAGNRTYGYFVWISLLLLLYWKFPSMFIFYSAICLSIFCLARTIAGSAGWLPMVSLVLVSPLCEYFASVFSFPIRLELTQIAGSLLHSIDSSYHAAGNILVKGSEEFSVDTACMGLYMLISALLTGIILIGICQRQMKRKLSLLPVLAIGASLLLLNLLANLIRIVSLVEFNVPPENPLHAGIGLACFACYTLLPASVLIKQAVARFGKPRESTGQAAAINPSSFLLQLPLLGLVCLAAVAGRGKSMSQYMAVKSISLPGYKSETLHDAIVKLSTDKVLVYLKPVVGCYASDHQPMICWKGSGYEFRKLAAVDLDGQAIFISTLEKNADRLYTAWWYDNGKTSTISQFTWRWDAFKTNNSWILVNITAASQQELFSQVRRVRKLNPAALMLDSN